MHELSLIGRHVRILSYSMGDDWHEGTIVKAYLLKECEQTAYEFLYDSGHSIIIMSDQIACVELIKETNQNKICKLNRVK